MEQERQQVEKVEISLTEIFFLNPEIKKEFIHTQQNATQSG